MQYLAALMGANFRPKETKEIITELATGQELSLEREPDNAYDANAVKVIYTDELEQSTFLGYVEKGIAEEITHLLASDDYTSSCKIIGWLGTIKPHLEITIEEIEE